MAFDPLKPPMSLKESERLLKAEDDRVRNGSNARFVFSGFTLIACVAILVLLVASIAFDLFGMLR